MSAPMAGALADERVFTRGIPSAGLRLLTAVQSSSPNPWVAALDGAVAAVGLMAAGLEATAATAFAAGFLAVAACVGLYRPRSTVECYGVLWYVRASAVPMAVLMPCVALLTPLSPSRLVATGLGIGTMLIAIRAAAWLGLAAARRRGLALQTAVLIGPAHALEGVDRRIQVFPEVGLRVATRHVVSPDSEVLDLRDGAEPLPRAKALVDAVSGDWVDHVVVCAGSVSDGELEELIHRTAGSGTAFTLVLPPVGIAGRPVTSRIGDLAVVPLGTVEFTGSGMWGKRTFDVLASSLLLVLLAPLLLLTALAIRIDDRGPIFYRQERVGRNGRLFRMWKFRSMVVGAHADQGAYADVNVCNGLLFKLDRDPRVTRVGSLIRRFSIDELPQLFNVLSGEMSLIGPRPLPVDPTEFDEFAFKRHAVRPGITGPWQVNGANALTYEDMVNLDLAYIAGWSFLGDLRLLFRTVPAVLVRRAPA